MVVILIDIIADLYLPIVSTYLSIYLATYLHSCQNVLSSYIYLQKYHIIHSCNHSLPHICSPNHAYTYLYIFSYLRLLTQVLKVYIKKRGTFFLSTLEGVLLKVQQAPLLQILQLLLVHAR